MAESIYNYLWGVVVPTLTRKIDYEAFCIEGRNNGSGPEMMHFHILRAIEYQLRCAFVRMHLYLFQTMSRNLPRDLGFMETGLMTMIARRSSVMDFFSRFY